MIAQHKNKYIQSESVCTTTPTKKKDRSMWWRFDVDDFHHYHASDVHILGKKLDKHGINDQFLKYGKNKKK
jgi:uncharacterized protein YjlB